MATPRVWTDDELLRLPDDGRKYELVGGALVVSPAGARHGQIIVRLTVRLAGFVAERGLGEVFDSSTGYRLPGGNLRSPDVSFVAAERLPESGVPEGFLYVPPDLAVEVLSPDDRSRSMAAKVSEYLAAGVRLIWVIDPDSKRALVHQSASDRREVGPSDSLKGEDVVPGFSCPLADLFV